MLLDHDELEYHEQGDEVGICEHWQRTEECPVCNADEDEDEDEDEDPCPHGRSQRWDWCDVCGFDALPF